MFTVKIDDKTFELIPLDQALEQTGLDPADLTPFEAGHEPPHPIWSDPTFAQPLAAKLVGSIAPNLPLEQYPTLPDQLAILLRNELTLASDRFEMSAEEKDLCEQRLQNVLRPIVYAVVQAKLEAADGQADLLTLEHILSETVGEGWQTITLGEWSVQELESALGLTGYRFTQADKIVVGQILFNSETRCYIEIAERVLQTLLKE